MSKKVILTEDELVNLVKKIINEQSVTLHNGLVIISGNKYRLEKNGISVNVDSIKPQKDGSFEVEGSKSFVSQKDILPKIEVEKIIELGNKGADVIEIRNKKGKYDKKLIKIKK